MRHHIKGIITCSVLICLLPGCGRVFDWVEDSFNQGTNLDQYTKVPQRYLRSITVYQQFTTIGMFDALWLSDAVRTAYVDLYALKHGKNDEQKKFFLRRQLEENNHFLSFYVLSLYENPLNSLDTKWSLFLMVDDKIYSPIEIKVVELNPEYILFFGKRYSRFKIPYLVKFNAKDMDSNFIVSDTTKTISLCFRSVSKEDLLTWDLRLY